MRITLLAALALLSTIALLPTPATATDYTVLIGWETPVDSTGLAAWYSLFFYPQELVIEYGDSVTWVWNSGEVHNVVFSGDGPTLSETGPMGTLTSIAGEVGNQTHFVDPTALYSSGIRNSHVTTPATLVFIPETGSGTFRYYCSIHGGMIAFITVLPAGEVAPLTPAEISTSAEQLIVELEQVATQEIAAIQAAAPATGPGVTHKQLPDGTNEWTVIGGAMWMNGNISFYARFLPSYLEINLNDTVTWITEGDDPHYVYFQTDDIWPPIYTNWSTDQTTPVCASCSTVAPEYILGPQFDPNPPHEPLLVLPTAIWPNPSGIVNSGLIFSVEAVQAAMGQLPFPTSYSVKFVETGVFRYMCAIHLDIGMIAEVRVNDLGAPVCTNHDDQSTCAAVTTTPVSVLGDPAFVGLRGQSYQVHGIDGAVYSVISEETAQVNARFAFLTGPRPCPSVAVAWSESEPATHISCWSHDGSYLSELALFTPSARLFIQAGPAATGFAAVDFSGSAGSGELWYQQLSSHHLTVTLGSFTLHVDNSDSFVNIARVTPLMPLDSLSSHGLLGQTHTRPAGGKRGGVSGAIEGEVDDYMVAGGLWAADDMYSKYGAASQ